MKTKNKGNPIVKPRRVRTSVVITLHPSHVKRLEIDDMTFFEQQPVENGILLVKRILS